MKRLALWMVLSGLLCAGCESTTPRLNAPPHGDSEKVTALQGSFVYMVDNGLLATMTVSDIHFVPNRPMLNSLGEERLRRLASLMEEYGGTIRFNTDEPDAALVKSRTDTVLAFLSECGLSVTADTVKEAMPGGPGMRASEAIAIKLNEGTYIPQKNGGGSGAPAMPTFSGGGSAK